MSMEFQEFCQSSFFKSHALILYAERHKPTEVTVSKEKKSAPEEWILHSTNKEEVKTAGVVQSYREDDLSNGSILPNVSEVGILDELWCMVINVSYVDHHHGHITERGWALPRALNGQVILMTRFKVQAPIDV